ncbi:hypothetical protein LJC19_04870 [Oxalobacter sp. OttesenSCG-928-P03]|nr:hypothetical protein [Oxalobacter sp. OttesenSCG-928-P03]
MFVVPRHAATMKITYLRDDEPHVAVVCDESGSTVDPEALVSFYRSQGREIISITRIEALEFEIDVGPR